MSRTYRNPKPSRYNRARKYVDGGGHHKKWSKQIEEMVGPAPVHSILVKGGTHGVWVDVPRPKWYPKKDPKNPYIPWVPWEKNWQSRKYVEVPGRWQKTEEYFQWQRTYDHAWENFVRPVGYVNRYGKVPKWARKHHAREMRRFNRQQIVREEYDSWAQPELYLNRWWYC